MSAAVLRQAAALMRERGEAARSWWPSDDHDGMDEAPWMDDEWWSAAGLSKAAGHAASWHPAVALAVADWLDRAADMHEHREMNWHERESDADKAKKQAAIDHLSRHALAVAHAYLGDQS